MVGIERDDLDDDDKFMRHLAQVVRNALGDRAGTWGTRFGRSDSQ